jgi:membrane-associated phospholipid phosphatase
MKHPHVRPVWALTGALACLDFLLSPFAGFTVAAAPLFWVLGLTAILLSASVFYDKIRPEPPIAAALTGAAIIIPYSAVAAIFSYLSTATALPLQDSVYALIDEAMGFNFVEHLRWIAERPPLLPILEIIYFSCPAQTIVIIWGLAFVDRPALGRFIQVYAVSAMAVIALGALVPAVGPYTHYPISPDVFAHYQHLNAGSSQVEHFMTLRAGTFQHMSLAKAEGLVNFPSFHAALAVIFARAFWRLPYMRYPGLALNAAMMLSALSIGGHYLIDLLGGSAIAAAALFWLDRSRQPRLS